MSALSVIQAMLVDSATDLLTNTTGGTSEGNPAAGTSAQDSSDPTLIQPATTGDRAGAGFLTALLLFGTVGGAAFMLTGV